MDNTYCTLWIIPNAAAVCADWLIGVSGRGEAGDPWGWLVASNGLYAGPRGRLWTVLLQHDGR